MTWHVTTIRCPVCNVPAKCDEVAFREDAMVRLEGDCPSCHKRLFMEEHIADAIPEREFSLETFEYKGLPC